MQFKTILRRGKKPAFDYIAVAEILKAGKAYVVDSGIKLSTVRGGLTTLRGKMPKGTTVKIKGIEGTEKQVAYVPVKEIPVKV